MIWETHFEGIDLGFHLCPCLGEIYPSGRPSSVGGYRRRHLSRLLRQVQFWLLHSRISAQSSADLPRLSQPRSASACQRLKRCPCENPWRLSQHASPLRCRCWRLPSWHLEKALAWVSQGALATWATSAMNEVTSASRFWDLARSAFLDVVGGSRVST